MPQYSHNSPYYELHLSELQDDAVRVLAFEGIENISRLFKYSFHLLSEDAQLNAQDILNKKATFILNRGDENPLNICGIISRFEQRGQSPDYASYYAELVPKMWRLGLNFQNRVFQNMDVEKMVTEVLETAEFSSDDFEFKLNETYPELEFAVQYRESDFDFINRRLEHFGIYYYLEHRDENDVIVFTDANENLPKIEAEEDVLYNPNKDPLSEIETVSQFIYQGQVVTGKTQLKDYNYREPSKDLLSESELDSENRPGTYYNYGDHYKDETEGQFLARVRNEEIICNSVNYKGKSDCRLFHAGFKFTLGEHFRDDWNADYLLIKILIKGNQRGLFGILQPSGKVEPTYENYFEALPSDISFRPKRLTQHPKIHGILNAKIDSTNDGEQAEIDDQGRYKVILPFDLSGNSDGEASHYIRMIQPYAGPNYGTHFPLHKDTEVLLTFIDGNPDRPIISGAVPNPETISPVTNQNQAQSVIRDNYGNEIIMDATPGDEHIRFYSPHHKSGIELGRSVTSWTDSEETSFIIGNKAEAILGTKAEATIGFGGEFKAGMFGDINIASEYSLNLTGKHSVDFGYEHDISFGSKKSESRNDMLNAANCDQIVAAGDQLCLVGGGRNKNTSIINAHPESIKLSIGEEVNILDKNRSVSRVEKGKKNLYTTKFEWNNFLLQAIAIAAGAVGYGSTVVALETEAENGLLDSNWQKILGYVGTAVGGLGALIMFIVFWIKEFADDKVEPVEHHDPSAILNMENSGILLGIKPKSKKVAKKEVIDFASEMDSRIALHDDGLVHIRSYEGKKEIRLGVGKAKKPDSFIRLINEGLGLKSGKSEIGIKKDGDIGIESQKKLNIKSANSMNLESNYNDINISAKSSVVRIKCSLFTANKNLKVLQ